MSSLLSVDWDETSVRVRVLSRLDPTWNQDFRWADITRVCLRDRGVFASDILFLEVRGKEKPATIPTEAQRGTEFLAELVGRGLFPKDVFERAISSSSGDIYCWPPNES